MALYIPTSAEIKKIQQAWQVSQVIGDTGYVAPTVYLNKNVTNVPNWKYYSTKAAALKQLYYLTGEKGFASQPETGAVSFRKDGTAQTFGINVDFYLPVSTLSNVPLPYTVAKDLILNTKLRFLLVRFTTVNGSGPYYAVFNSLYFGMSATTVKATGERFKAYDKFYREVQLLKTKYNTLVTFLTKLSEKQLSAKEQQIFNKGILLKDNLYQQIKQVKGIEIYTSSSGGIGVVAIPVIWVIALIAAVAASWTIVEINKEWEKSKRINDANDVQKWVAEQMQIVAADPKISAEDKKRILKTLSDTADSASKVAEKSAEDEKGLFGEIGNILKWGIIGIVAMKVLDTK